MAKRKTIPVATIKHRINAVLAMPTTITEVRMALCYTLEAILHETDNYHGFNYVDWMNGGCDRWVEAGQPEGPEKAVFFGPEYKREYF